MGAEVKAVVMALLLADAYARWGKAGAAEVENASRIADDILKASQGPAPAAAPPAPTQHTSAAGATMANMRQFMGAQLPGLPNPQNHPGGSPVPVPGAVSPEGTVDTKVLDLSQPR